VFGKADRWLFWATASGFEWPARFNPAADAARQCGALSSELDSGAAHVILVTCEQADFGVISQMWR
jgi:hypothetical protein